MKNNIEQTAENLFDKLRNRFSPIEIKDENQKSTLDPKDARYFIFDYVDLSTGNSFGNITISIAGKDLEFVYTKDITASMTDQEKTQWYKFLKNLRFFAMRELGAKKESGTFDVRDISKSGLQLKDLKHISTKSGMVSKDEVSMSESKLYGSRNRSYQKLDDVKIIAKHNKPIVDETIPGIRSRNVESFFIENNVGERFKLPEGTSINGARAYARHIKNGGQIFDDFGNHIGKIIKEMSDLKIFVRNMRGKTFEDFSTQQMVETAIDHYGKLHSDLFSLRHQRGYEQYKELWTPEVLEEENFDLNELKERFVKKIFDERLMNALPIVYREYSKKKVATEQEFESWANDVIAEYAKHPTDDMNKQDANHAEDIEEDQIDVNVKGPFSNSLRSVQRDSEDNAIDDDKENQSLAGVFRDQGFQFRFQDGIYYFESKDEIERAKDWIAYKFPKMEFPKMGIFDYGYGIHGSTTFDRELPGGKGVMEEVTNENLRKWFKEKWVRFGPDGKIRGQCARDDDSEGKPKCLPKAKAYALGKKKRATSAARKRREDPNSERKGPAKNVKTESGHTMNKDFDKFKQSLIKEGDVIRTKFSTKQSQKAKDIYQRQSDVADDIPVYDPKTGRSVLPKFAKGHEVPFQKFIAQSVSDRVTRILGITDDGKQIAVSTFGAPIEFVEQFVDALNRGGFSKVPIQKVPLGNMFKEEQAHGSPADRGSADAWYGRRARPHKVVDGQHIDITDRQDPEYQEYMDAYNKTRNDPMMRDVIDENEKGVTAEQLNIGDEVIITGPVKFNGNTGVIADFGRDKSFVVVDLYNYGKKSFHSSDVEENLYAGSEEEDEDLGYPNLQNVDNDVKETRHFRTDIKKSDVTEAQSIDYAVWSKKSPEDQVRLQKVYPNLKIKNKPRERSETASQPKKLTLADVWRKVETVVAQVYPNGDPIDWLTPWFAKHGIRDYKVGEILDRAARKHGYKSMYHYYDSMGELNEAKTLKKRVRVVKGRHAGKTGWIREIKLGAFKGAPKSYFVDLDDGTQENNVLGSALRLIRDEQGVVETSDYARRRKREEAIISGEKPPRKKQAPQTSDYARRRAQEKAKEQGVVESERFSEPPLGYRIVYRKSGAPVINTPIFDTREAAQKYLINKMSANHQNYQVSAFSDSLREESELTGVKLYNAIVRMLKATPGLKFSSKELDAGSFKAWYRRLDKIDLTTLIQQLKSIDPMVKFIKASAEEPWSIQGANFRLDGPDQNYRGDSGLFLEVYRAGPGGKLRRAGSDEPIAEGLIGKLAAAGALVTGLGMAGYYLDRTAPKVSIQGNMAYVVPEDHGKIPPNALTLKGDDGVTYRVWMSKRKEVFAYPLKDSQRTDEQGVAEGAPNFNREWDEATRYPEFVNLGKEKWIELVSKGKQVTVTRKNVNKINNTDAADPKSFKLLDTEKQKRALAQLANGDVEMPIVARYSDGYLELIGGNTRLTAQMAKDGQAKVWLFKVPEELTQGVAEGAEIVDQDSDLDQQVYTLMVDGDKVSFTYWDYEDNFQNPDIKEIYQQAREQLGKKLSPEQVKAVARAVFKSFEQGVAEGADWVTKADRVIAKAKKAHTENPTSETKAALSAAYAAKRKKQAEWAARKNKPTFSDKNWSPYNESQDVVEDYSSISLSEKQDACYNKVKSRYKVWPSAYASGALVQCRKKGAKNWGKNSTNESKIHQLIDNFKSNLSKY